MVTELLQVEQAQPTREQRIVEVMQANGNMMTAYELATACISEGIWTEDELKRIYMRSVQDACIKALQKKDDGGLPTYLPSADQNADRQPIWKLRQLCLFEDYEVNILAHIKQRNEDHIVALKLAIECEDRHGRTVVIPELPSL